MKFKLPWFKSKPAIRLPFREVIRIIPQDVYERVLKERTVEEYDVPYDTVHFEILSVVGNEVTFQFYLSHSGDVVHTFPVKGVGPSDTINLMDCQGVFKREIKYD